MKKQGITLLCSVLLLFRCVLFDPVSVQARNFTPPFELSSEGVYLMNLETEQVIYEKNPDQPLVPASLTKIMTAILTLEYESDLSTMVTASYDVFNELYGKNASNAGLLPGEELSIESLLYGLLLKSGCDAAGVLARYVANGDPDQFVAMMNQKAQEIGATNTLFTDSHGLDAERQRSTARDMTLITQYALRLPHFERIATTPYYELPPTNKRGEKNTTRYWTHTNQMLHQNMQLYHPNVKGIKTGTAAQQKSLVSLAEKEGSRYLLVVMGGSQFDAKGNVVETAMIESNMIYRWLFDTFSMRSLVDLTTYYTELAVQFGKGRDYVIVVPSADALAFLPKDSESFRLEEEIKRVVVVPNELTAPIEKGAELATLSLQLDGEELGSLKLIASESLERSTLKWLQWEIEQLMKNLWFQVLLLLLLFLLVLYIILMIRYNQAKRRKRQRQKRS